MKRLGWTTEQGRDYLLQAYKKRWRFAPIIFMCLNPVVDRKEIA
jgi:hypothetical protein